MMRAPLTVTKRNITVRLVLSLAVFILAAGVPLVWGVIAMDSPSPASPRLQLFLFRLICPVSLLPDWIWGERLWLPPTMNGLFWAYVVEFFLARLDRRHQSGLKAI
jgi:hypothetical protein